MSNVSTTLWGLLQAWVTVFICGLATVAFIQLQGWESSTDGFIDKVALLLLFVTSALVSGTVVLARPAYLILHQRTQDGFLLLLSTIVWLVIILVGILIGIIFFDIHTIF